MRILITGSTGFIGQKVLKAMLEEDYSVAVLVRDTNKVEEKIRHQYLGKQLKIIDLSLQGWKEEVKTFQPTIVIHLAAFLTSLDTEEFISTLISANLDFACHLLDSLRDTGLQYFINTGTFAEYQFNDDVPHPAYLYAATKTAFRSILSYFQSILGFKIVNIIPYTIYGGVNNQKKILDFIYASIDTNTPVKMSPGEQVLDFIHIDDVVNFYKKLVSSLKLINMDYLELPLGTSIGTSPKKIASIIEGITKQQTNIEWGALPYRQNDTMYSVANLSVTSSVLNWKPNISIEDGVKLYIENFKNKG